MSMKKPSSSRSSALSLVRHLIFASALGFFASKYLKPILLPHGGPTKVAMEDRPRFSPVDIENDSLRTKHGKTKRIYETPPTTDGETIVKGPETVVVNPSTGDIYVLTEEAKLVRLDNMEEQKGGVVIMAKATEVVDLGVGRPLGGAWSSHDDSLYIADTLLGLIRVKQPESPNAKVELVASRVQLDNGTWSRIMYCNDVAVGQRTGKVYFTDSSTIAPDRRGVRTWDTMYASKIDYIRGRRTGRLLEYDPQNDRVRVLANGMWFANGVAVVDEEETSLVISETYTAGIRKFDLATGTLSATPIVGNFTGYPDGLGCDPSPATTNTLCYAPMPTKGLKLSVFLSKLPHPLDQFLRTILMGIPRSWAPKIVPYGGVVEFDPVEGEIRRYLQDPDGQDIGMLTGATVHNKKLYLGSLRNDYIAVYDLE